MSANIHCLYLSYDGLTDPLGQSQVLPYLIGLSQLGHKISIISFEKPQVFEDQKETTKKLIEPYNIIWHPLSYTKSPPVLSTIYDLQRMWGKAVSIMKASPYKLVHCRSYLPAIIGEKLKKRFGISFIFDMRGFWADERVDGNIWDIKNPIYRTIYNYFKRKEKALLQKADHTVTLTNKAVNIINSWVTNPISVIPCCADLSLFDYIWFEEEQKKQTRDKLGIQNGSFILNYLGSIGTWYMLPEMLDFFKCLLKHKPNSTFQIISHENSHSIREIAESKNIPLEKIIVIPAQRNEIPSLLSIVNYSIFFIKPTFSKQGSSPTKQAELMGMGIPIICNTGVGDTDTIITESQSGFLISEFSESAYNVAIEKVLNTSFSKEDIRKYAREHFDLKKAVKAYGEIYKSLLAPIA